MLSSRFAPWLGVLGCAGGGYLLQAATSGDGVKDVQLLPTVPSRDSQVAKLSSSRPDKPFDVLIIGGGATGTGIAVDAATRCVRPCHKQHACARLRLGSSVLMQLVVQQQPAAMVHSSARDRGPVGAPHARSGSCALQMQRMLIMHPLLCPSPAHPPPAPRRGLSAALVERADFASGTSSKSTKLVHGGVRYLEQAFKKADVGQLKLVYEALQERAALLANAPHLTGMLPILMPCYKWWEVPFYWAGLKAYDVVAAGRNLAWSKFVLPGEALRTLPTLAPEGAGGRGLKGAVRWARGGDVAVAGQQRCSQRRRRACMQLTSSRCTHCVCLLRSRSHAGRSSRAPRRSAAAPPSTPPRPAPRQVLYYDGQFDDARLNVALAATAAAAGAAVANYVEVTGLIKVRRVACGA